MHAALLPDGFNWLRRFAASHGWSGGRGSNLAKRW